MTVVAADCDERAAAETAAIVAAAGGTAQAETVDVADEAAVQALADRVVRDHGRVSLLANNAGVSIYGSIAELAADEIAWLMGVNFWGVVHGTKAFLPVLLAQPEAAIVNVSSVFGLWGPPGQAAYAASKFAVRGFTDALRAELFGTNVLVVTVHPGGIKTAIARSARVARAADPNLAAASTRAFEQRLLTTPPETLAGAVVDAVRRGRERVVAGSGAKRIDVLTRLFPERAPRWFTQRLRRGT
jgi:NAD(P)-dependent dehydrogenase (short-subunit alcohol dehydrogenase family)